MTVTDELRRMLDERGVEWWSMHDAEAGYYDDRDTEFLVYGCKHVAHEWGCRLQVDMLTPEQAIAATLGSELPYDELLRCLENDWHISASWDGLRKFWCIELTEEGVKLRNSAHVTLTAEQVMGIAGKHQPDYCSDTHVCFDWQAIADELNATLGSGTCKVESSYAIEFNTLISTNYYEFEMSCGFRFSWSDNEPPDHCPGCGRKVVHDGS